MPDFARILRAVRKNYNLTQEEAAEVFIIPLATLQRTEAGKRDLTYRELERVAEYCRKGVHEIVQLEAEKEGLSMPPAAFKKENQFENIINTQNGQITSLLEEIKNLYGVIRSLMSRGDSGRNLKG